MGDVPEPVARTEIELTVVIEMGKVIASSGRAEGTRRVSLAPDEKYFVLQGHVGDQIDDHTVRLIVDAVLIGPETDLDQMEEIPCQ